MSLKKTWFSYVLWAVLTLLTGVTAYVSGVMVYALHPMIVVTAFVGIAGVFVLFHFVCGKIRQFTISKWMDRVLHTIVFFAITTAFVMLRLPVITNIVDVTSSQQATWFYEASRVGRDVLGNAGITSVIEQVYINLLSAVFLFLGNKIEVLVYMQVILQVLSYILLIFIGWTLQKRVYAWVPAFLYAVSPFMSSSIEDVGPANFWMCIVIFVLFVICMLQGAWKNRNITYIVAVITQIIIGIVACAVKMDVLWYGESSFVTGGYFKGTEGLFAVEMLITVILLISYCVSFWFNKQDHKTLYIIPFIFYCIILTIAAFYEYETYVLFMMLAAMNLYFLVAESVRVLFTCKPEVVTGSIVADTTVKTDKKEEPVADKPSVDFDWSEMKEIMQKDAVKEKTAVTEERKDLADESTTVEEVPVIDRTTPIENVLPMPKKHTPKVLDYAFEPTEDMMHYDVELENDEYDY